MSDTVIEGVLVPADAQREIEEAKMLPYKYQSFAIATGEQYTSAAAVLREVKTRAKALDDWRKSITKPMDEAKARVMALFKLPIEALAQAESSIKGAILAWDREQDRIRKAEEARLLEERRKEQERLAQLAQAAQQAVDKERQDKNNARINAIKAAVFEKRALAAAAAPLAVPPPAPKAAGVSTRQVWKFEVEDFSKLPDSFKLANTEMLGQVARSTKGKMEVPGVRFYVEDVVVGRQL
jgi:hypothetical protein